MLLLWVSVSWAWEPGHRFWEGGVLEWCLAPGDWGALDFDEVRIEAREAAAAWASLQVVDMVERERCPDSTAPDGVVVIHPYSDEWSSITCSELELSGKGEDRGGCSVYYMSDWTLFVSRDVDYATSIDACSDKLVLSRMLKHELGHALGLNHSWDDHQIPEAPSEAEAQAVMYWAMWPCEDRTPNEDDEAALRALYGLSDELCDPPEEVGTPFYTDPGAASVWGIRTHDETTSDAGNVACGCSSAPASPVAFVLALLVLLARLGPTAGREVPER